MVKALARSDFKGFSRTGVEPSTIRHIVVGNKPRVLTGTTADLTSAFLMAAAIGLDKLLNPRRENETVGNIR